MSKGNKITWSLLLIIYRTNYNKICNQIIVVKTF